MKRFLIISLVVVFAVVMMAVPAFAAEYTYTEKLDEVPAGSYEFIQGQRSYNSPPLGKYNCQLYYYQGTTGYSFLEFEIVLYGDSSPVISDNSSNGHNYIYCDSEFDHNGDVYQFSFTADYLVSDSGYFWDPYYVLYCEGDDVTSDQYGYRIDRIILTPVPVFEPVSSEGAADAVLSVFSVIGDWMIAQIPVVGALFYNSEAAELTALGSICVCALGVAFVLLLLSLVKRWIQFR